MKNRILTVIICCFVLMFQETAFGQLTTSTQYLYNPYVINPAAAGLNGNQNIYANYRLQWVSFPTAPKTAMFSYNGRFNKNGLGLTVANDQAGSLERNNISAAYSYYIPINESSRLSVGLAAAYQRFTLSLNSNDRENINLADPVIADALDGVNTLDFSTGVFYQNDNGLYAGLSVPNLLQTKLNGNADISNDFNDFAAYYYGLVGYAIKKDKFTFDPSILLRKETAAPLQMEINAKVRFMNDLFTLGTSYRTQDNALGFIFGVNIENKVQFYYSYDTSFGVMNAYNGGSNEITLGYIFGNKPKNQ
ncbi:MAG: PorP/SprF family type IX secretion system membrane protein [Saprospiraceae bacterium]